MALSTPHFFLFDDHRQEAQGASELTTIKGQVLAGQLEAPWSVQDGLVPYDRKVYVHPTSPSLSTILEAAHAARHNRVQKTLLQLKAVFLYHA